MEVLSAFRSPSTRWHTVIAAMLLCISAASSAQAQTDNGDPPTRVARLSYLAGDLGVMPAGASDWADASVNRPLTNGDKLSSGPDAKAELELGGAALRIAGQTDIGVLNLNDQLAQIELNQGTLNLNVRNLADGETYEIDTPTLALVVAQPGIFRVDVSGNGGATTVTVFRGGATVYGENNAQHTIYGGRSYVFGDSSLNNVMISDIQGGDAFDAWCSDRDNQYADAGANPYVSDDVVGAQDLDSYGAWQDDPEYGQIWYPTNVAVGWAPYRFGHWVWIAPWGWTWIDNLPWGFAPYHYGRWAHVRGVWGWLPGPRTGRAVYAPALVAFVGGGAGRPVGWFPLGPGEIYNPWYRVSRGYYTNLNVTNINNRFGGNTLVNNINNHYSYYQSGRTVPNANYVNRQVPNAVSAMSAENFAGARNVQSNLVHVSAQDVAAAPVLNGNALQRPTAASFGPARNVNARPLPAAAFNRPVVARNAPAATLRTNTIVRSGLPATSNVRVLNTSHGFPSGTGMRPTRQSVEHEPADNEISRPVGMLPQEPRFERAQQVQPMEQRAVTPEQRTVTQERFDPAERAHSYVPEQRYQEESRQVQQQNPERNEYIRTPEPYQEFQHSNQAPHQSSTPQAHGQSAPSAHPAANNNGH